MTEPEFKGFPGIWRTARKEQVCWHCLDPIRPGARHFEYLGDTPSYQSGKRFHRDCAVDHFERDVPHVRRSEESEL
jgi:hypothetical protein